MREASAGRAAVEPRVAKATTERIVDSFMVEVWQ